MEGESKREREAQCWVSAYVNAQLQLLSLFEFQLKIHCIPTGARDGALARGRSWAGWVGANVFTLRSKAIQSNCWQSKNKLLSIDFAFIIIEWQLNDIRF